MRNGRGKGEREEERWRMVAGKDSVKGKGQGVVVGNGTDWEKGRIIVPAVLALKLSRRKARSREGTFPGSR